MKEVVVIKFEKILAENNFTYAIKINFLIKQIRFNLEILLKI